MIGLACQTKYLLLDEAFDGLDPTMRIIVKKMLIDTMVERSLTVIISSHNLKEIGEVCDTVALIYQGKVVFTRELDKISENIHKVQLAFSEMKEASDFNPLQVLHYEQNGSIINMIIKGQVEELHNKIDPMNPIVFDHVPLTLEEVFIYEMEGLGYEYTGL